MIKGNRIYAVFLLCLMFLSCYKGNDSSFEFNLNPEKQTILVINADDAGMHKDCDRAIFDLLDAGKIQTFSMMVPGPTYHQVLKEVQRRNIPVGIHLTLTNEWQEKCGWSPVLPKSIVPSLYNPRGFMWASVEELTKNATVSDIRKELTAQIEEVHKAGIPITHMDAHMLFWHKSKKIKKIYYDLAREYGLIIIPQEYFKSAIKQRKATNKLLKKGVKTPNVYEMYYEPDFEPTQRRAQYTQFLKSLKPGITHLAVHPVYETESNTFMHDVEMRADDFDFLHSSDFDNLVEKQKVVLKNYSWIGNE